MFKFSFWFIFLLSFCKSKHVETSERHVDPDSLASVSTIERYSHQIDTSTFEHFLKLVENEEDIPKNLFQKFVRLKNDSTILDQTEFFGKRMIKAKNYFILNVKYGDMHRSYNAFISIDPNSKQTIDDLVYLYYCRECRNELFASVYYKNTKFRHICVDFTYPSNTESMPLEDGQNIVKREVWKISKKGKFILR
jgi:hypothetical protein